MVSTIVHSQVNDLMNNPQFKEFESSKIVNSTFEENNEEPFMKKIDEETEKNEKNVNL